MKKLIIGFILLMAATGYSLTFNASDPKTFNNAYQWTGNPKDRATQWAIDMQALVEAGFNLGTGSIFYVDSNVTNEGEGTSWASAKDTLDEAVGLCTASNGDLILVAQGHNEALTAPDAVDVDVIGVTIVGIGNGSLKPTFDYDAKTTAPGGEFVIGAANVTIANLRFRTSSEAVANAIDIEDGVDYASILACDIGYPEAVSDEFDDPIIVGSLSHFVTVSDCLFVASAAEQQSCVLFNGDSQGHIITNNKVTGTIATAVIEGATGPTLDMLIDGNHFYTVGTADTFNLVAASTGIISNNIMVMNAADAATALDIGNCFSISNWMIADDDTGGTKAGIEVGNAVIAASFVSVTATADD